MAVLSKPIDRIITIRDDKKEAFLSKKADKRTLDEHDKRAATLLQRSKLFK